MHCLHCILIEVDDNVRDLENAETVARGLAMSATEWAQGTAFDYRSEDDAGAWGAKFPKTGVVMGAKKPDRFTKLLLKFKDEPLKNALETLMYYSNTDFEQGITVNKKYIRLVWELGEYGKSDPDAWVMSLALRLVQGEYLFDSGFYSVPDNSSKISKQTLEDALAHPEKYALVFSDYHI